MNNRSTRGMIFLMVTIFIHSFLYGGWFEKSEYAARRKKLMEKIPDGIAIIMGAQLLTSYFASYQNNDFMYFSGVEMKDCSQFIWDLRIIKSPAEIKLLRKVAQIGVKAHIQLMQSTEVGMPERELAALFEYICKKEGI